MFIGKIPRQKSHQATNRNLKNEGKECKTGQVSAYHAQKAEIRRILVESQSRQIVHKTLSRKIPTQKRFGGVAQVRVPAWQA
jgi:hypothetical protein